MEYDRALLSVTTHSGLEMMTPFDWVALFTDMMRLFRSHRWITRSIQIVKLEDTVVTEMWTIVSITHKPHTVDWFSWNNVLYPEILNRPASFLRSIKRLTCPFRIYNEIVPRVLVDAKDYDLLIECLNQSPQPYKPKEVVPVIVRWFSDTELRFFWEPHFPNYNRFVDPFYLEIIKSNIQALDQSVFSD